MSADTNDTDSKGTEETVESLLEKLEAANSKAEDNWNQCLRARADLENTRKRSLKDVDNARKFSLEKFAKELLNVLDSIEQGLTSTESVEGEEAGRIREGMVLTHKMFLDTIDKFGVKAINVQPGDSFNPSSHEAIAAQENDEYAPNTVMAVMQNGYSLYDRVLRPARVIVAKASEGSDGEHKRVDIKA